MRIRRRPSTPSALIAAVGTVLGLVVGVVVGLVAVPSAQAAVVKYVALGDSYASGVGAGSYIGSSGSCLRSTKAYSALWASAHSPASYTSAACSGAKTTDVISKQLGALSASTTLVSITIGGNDVGFSSVLSDCVLDGTSTCVSDINAAEAKARSTLPGLLDSVYTAIRGRAPAAHVVVLGYPRFYDTGVWYCIGLSGTSRSKINEGADVLDGVISAAAARHGFAFADVRSRFAADHEICDGGSSWLHSVDWTDLGQSYHPTAGGQSGGYLPAFSAAA
jgi:lysophospholipase L1-like esterase